MKQFIENLKGLNKQLEKQNSYKLVFLRGIILGLGSAIGATVIASVVIWALSVTINTIEDIPIVGNFLEVADIAEDDNSYNLEE